MNLKFLTWDDMEAAVSRLVIPQDCDLYPLPLGGFLMAAALSRKFGVPVTEEISGKTMIVTCFIDSGENINRLWAAIGMIPVVAWVKRSTFDPNRDNHFITFDQEVGATDYLVFPWEKPDHAKEAFAHHISGPDHASR